MLVMTRIVEGITELVLGFRKRPVLDEKVFGCVVV
jgi:hypothetical protein